MIIKSHTTGRLLTFAAAALLVTATVFPASNLIAEGLPVDDGGVATVVSVETKVSPADPVKVTEETAPVKEDVVAEIKPVDEPIDTIKPVEPVVGFGNGGGGAVMSYDKTTHYHIAASAGVGGTITPNGSVSVDSGHDKNFDITPNTHYIVSDVLKDGATQGRLNSYEFTNVHADHTIAASFDGGWKQPGDNDDNNVSHPEHAYSSNNDNAEFNSSDDWVKYGNFNLSTLDTDVFSGIEVALEGHRDSGSTRNLNVSLSWDGAHFTDPISATGWTSADKTVVIGGSSNNWGHTWTWHELNHHLVVKVQSTGTGGGDKIYLDQIQVKIHTNTAPVAAADTYTLPEDSTSGLDVVFNDYDADGDKLVITDATSPTGATLGIIHQDALALDYMNYMPAENLNGPDSFTYTISDGNGGFSTATVNLTITPVNDVPAAQAMSVSTHKNVPVPLTLVGTDVDMDALAFEVISVGNGTFTPDAGGVVTVGTQSSLPGIYRPNTNFVSSDELQFMVTDPSGATSTAIASITVGESGGFTVSNVTATPPAGTYVGAQSVTLEAIETILFPEPVKTPLLLPPLGLIDIHYTTDGSDPTCGTGEVFTNPISVPADMTIRAIACYPFDYSSATFDFPYIIQAPPTTPPTGGNGGGAPLPGGSSLTSVQQVYDASPSPLVLGASTVNPIVGKVLGAATCLSRLDDPMGVVRPDKNLAKRLMGRILLKVQACGEAWYVNPATLQRHKLANGNDAVAVMRSLALKVTDVQLNKVTLGDINVRKGKATVAAAYSGRVLQAPDGSLWYVNPADGKRYSINTSDEILKVMRLLGIGITNVNIAKIPVAE
jgi:hypothetical protein